MILIFRSDRELEISLETFNGKERHYIETKYSEKTSSVVDNVLKSIRGQATFVIFRFMELLNNYPHLKLSVPEITVGVGITIKGSCNQFISINPLDLKALKVTEHENADTIFRSDPNGLFSIPSTKKTMTQWSTGS
jgi:hypothetical protein